MIVRHTNDTTGSHEMFETLEVNTQGPIGTLWLNRPDRLNALSTTALNELALAARWFDEQSEVRDRKSVV